ncbi:hypothetical protein [Streptomyces sp. NPDC127033]|uniref:hypothetical protein n=1 Tax=Streptomyces sp. NPDC127033 TaxID=3347110 RepID=UPI00364780D4
MTVYRIEDSATAGALLYVPCLGVWGLGSTNCSVPPPAPCWTVRSTPPTNRERLLAGPGQPVMGLLLVSGEDGSLRTLACHPEVRRVCTHFNTTNLLLDSSSPAYAWVAEEGVEILPNGTEFTVGELRRGRAGRARCTSCDLFSSHSPRQIHHVG